MTVSPPQADEPDGGMPPKAEAQPPPPDADTRKHQKWLTQQEAVEPTKLLRRLDELLRNRHRDWGSIIKDVGPLKVREVVNGLKAALDNYNTKKAVKTKANRAEARLRDINPKGNA